MKRARPIFNPIKRIESAGRKRCHLARENNDGRTPMAKWTMDEVLRRALRLELVHGGEYQKGANEAKIPSLKAMFTFLAEEEKKHARLIRDKMAQYKVKE
jgi:rubrerythrin